MRKTALTASILFITSVARAAGDTQAIDIYRSGMRAIIGHVERQPVRATDLPRREERENARLLWRSFLDYQLALESIRGSHSDYLTHRGEQRATTFRIFHAAWLAQYRAALEFIDAAERHPEYHTVLNESDATLGLISGSYADFKLRWLNVARAAEYSALAVMAKSIGGVALPGAGEDAKFIIRAGAGSGTQQTFANAQKIVLTTLWTPIPQTIAAVGGGPEKPPPRKPYVSKRQLAALRRRLEPGDLVFQRREWALSNIGLPGFWPHVAMYVGTPEQRRRLFGDMFEERLRALNPSAYDFSWSKRTVVEAIGQGVITSAFEHSAHADSIAVVRPNIEIRLKAGAVERAFQYVGRPYDFAFDFATDDRIVCTELIYKAFEGTLDLPVMRLAGRSVTPANDYVRWFDERYDAQRDLGFVAFLDGQPQHGAAKEATLAKFRTSWKRPRWHALTPARGSEVATSRPR